MSEMRAAQLNLTPLARLVAFATAAEDPVTMLAAIIPHPAPLGQADQFGMLATHIVKTPMLNGETIHLDGAVRMAPR